MKKTVYSVEQFRQWGRKGGKCRMASMSQEDRQILAEKAAKGRALAAKRRADEAGKERRAWLKDNELTVSRKTEVAMRELELAGKRFLIDFGYDNAESIADSLRGSKRKKRNGKA